VRIGTLERAHREREAAELRAPRDGTVIYRMLQIGSEFRTARVGDTLAANQPFMMLPDPDRLIEETDPIGIEETELIAIIIESGQNFGNLALHYLGDPYLWPWIYYLNSDEIEHPNRVEPGTVVTVPLPSDTENLKDFELEQVAFGYVRVYQWYIEHNHADARNYLWAAGVYDLSVLDQAAGQVDPEDLRFARNR
jgi:hypothetical protein